MDILYENKNIVACRKQIGQSSEMSSDKPSIANEVFNTYGYAGVIHRLDTAVGGAIIYAKNKKTASEFSRLVSENKLTKEYLAVVEGIPDEKSGELRDFLFKDSHRNKVFAVKRMRKGVKEAILFYEVLQTSEYNGKNLSLVKIRLVTGRTHQIRVQFASRKMPLLGDGKYGSRENRCSVALWSHSLNFFSEFENTDINIVSYPPYEKFPWNLFEF